MRKKVAAERVLPLRLLLRPVTKEGRQGIWRTTPKANSPKSFCPSDVHCQQHRYVKFASERSVCSLELLPWRLLPLLYDVDRRQFRIIDPCGIAADHHVRQHARFLRMLAVGIPQDMV